VGAGDAVGIKKWPFVINRGVATLLESYRNKGRRWAFESLQLWMRNAVQDSEARSGACAH